MGDIELKNKSVLVVGGNGYLGSFLVKKLKEIAAHVVILSRNCKESETEFIADITNFEDTQRIIQHIKPDIVFHLAANISRNRDFSIYPNMLTVNVQGTLNVIQSLKGLDAHFIFTSSSEIYGNNESPFHEEQIPRPVSPYSLSKSSAELLIETYAKNNPLKYTILRVFNFFGEGMPEDFFIPQMIKSLKRGEDFLMTKGEQIRDFLYVGDVVNALVLTASHSKSYGETLNVCGGEGTELRALALSINKYVDSEAKVVLGALPYRSSEVWEMIGSNKKIKDLLGFEPEYTIEQGIEILINHL